MIWNLGEKNTSARECFPMVCTTGSFLKKLYDPETDPRKQVSLCPITMAPADLANTINFQRVIFDKLGFKDAEIISPSNDTAYADISGGQGTKFRFTAWKGFVAVDILRKLKQERRPYELIPGETDKVYKIALDNVIKSLRNRGKRP